MTQRISDSEDDMIPMEPAAPTTSQKRKTSQDSFTSLGLPDLPSKSSIKKVAKRRRPVIQAKDIPDTQPEQWDDIVVPYVDKEEIPTLPEPLYESNQAVPGTRKSITLEKMRIVGETPDEEALLEVSPMLDRTRWLETMFENGVIALSLIHI